MGGKRPLSPSWARAAVMAAVLRLCVAVSLLAPARARSQQPHIWVIVADGALPGRGGYQYM